MLLGARLFFERRAAPTPPLPYDAEVEYLESTGTQWIDTGVIPTVETEIYCGFTGFSRAWNLYIFGLFRESTYSSGSMSVATDPSYFSVSGPTRATSGWYRRIVPFQTDVKYDIYYCKNKFSANGVEDAGVNWSTEFVPEKNMYVFAVNSSSASNFQLGRLHYFRMTDSSRDLIDLIPVRFTNEQGVSEGAMYDRVSGALFRNQGTGNFIVGRDTNPVSARSYVNDGLIAMWDGIENAGWGVHDPNATTWKNLVTGSDSPLVGNAVFNESCLVCDAQSDGCTIGTWDYQTIEVVCTRRGGAYTVVTPYSQYRDVRNVIFASGFGYCGNDKGKVVSFTNYQSPHNVAFTFGDEYLAYGDGVLSTAGNYNDWWTIPAGYINSGNYDRAGIGDYYAVRLYSRALTAAEIAANYAIDKARFNLPWA